MSSSPGARPVYECIAQQLKQYGVEAVFTLMSEDTALLVATLDGMGIRVLSARHENSAICMAEGYSAGGRKLGVAIVGRGPATANGLHAATYASRTGSQVLIIYGHGAVEPSRNALGPDTKRFDSGAVLHAAGIETFMARTADSASVILHDAVSFALTGKLAAYLLPVDIQGRAAAERAATFATPLSVPSVSPRPRKQALEAARLLIEASERPLIVAGWGAHRAGAKDALERLADQLGAAVCTTMKAKDLFKGYKLNAGIVGSFSSAGGRRLIEQADCVLVFGAGLNQRTTSRGTALPKGVPVVHVDHSRAGVGQWYDADVAIVGDARQVAELLLEQVATRDRARIGFHTEDNMKLVAGFDPETEFAPANTSHRIDPRIAAIGLNRIFPQARQVVWDAGNFLGLLPLFDVSDPSALKTSSEFGSIGLGLGTALGFAVARPDLPTILVIGDGGLLMTLGELETLAREGIALTVVVVNDSAYGAETHFLKNHGMPVAKSLFADVDFSSIAQALGIAAVSISSRDDMATVLAKVRDGDLPLLIDCKVNGSVAAAFTAE